MIKIKEAYDLEFDDLGMISDIEGAVGGDSTNLADGLTSELELMGTGVPDSSESNIFTTSNTSDLSGLNDSINNKVDTDMYTVKQGDTLSGITQQYTGDGSAKNYNTVAQANGISDPNVINPGQRIDMSSVTGGEAGVDTVTSTDFTNKDEYNSGVFFELDPSGEQSMASSFGAYNNYDSSAMSSLGVAAGVVSSLYEVCTPASVNEFIPTNSFQNFVIKENAGDMFVQVSNQVSKVCECIENVSSNLQSTRTDMGDNTGTTTEIDRIVQSLSTKEDELRTKVRELINACDAVVDYINTNKQESSAQAQAIATTIANIQI